MITGRMNGTERVTENEPTPNERMPPRKTRTKLRRATTSAPEPNWLTNTMEIQSQDRTLKPLPTNADPNTPVEAKLPLYFFYFLHHLFPEENKKNRAAAR